MSEQTSEQPVLLAAAKLKQGTKKKEVKKAVTKNAQNPLQAISQRLLVHSFCCVCVAARRAIARLRRRRRCFPPR